VADDFGKKSAGGGHKKFDGNIWKRLDFLKIRAISPMVGPTIIPHLAAFVNRQIAQKSQLTAIS
jgi:hypothetical protein